MKRIILIDDDSTTNALNKMIIERSDLVDEVLMFNEAQKALEFFKEEPGDRQNQSLILLDINMPLMDGWEFLNEYIKLNGSRRGEKVVMLTSSIDPKDMTRAEEYGPVSEFKSKPLSIEMLKTLVIKHF